MNIFKITNSFILIPFITVLLSYYDIKSGNDSRQHTKDIEAKYDSTLNKKRVLVLNAYHEGFHWTDKIMSGIKSAFDGHENIELFINYMDTKRCSDSIYFNQLQNIYKYKYKQIKFDAIISTDDHALDFLLQYRDSIFPHVPVVFCGINDYKPTRIENNKLFTGVYESYDVEGTINLILKLHPKTKEVIIVSDATVSGKAFNDRIKRIESKFKEITSIKFLTNLPPNLLKKELESASKKSVIIWSIYIRKPDGTVFTSKESIKLITSSTAQPVYCVWDVVNQGVVGGKITDPVFQGKRSSEIALDLLNGIPISEMKVEGSPLVYKFDFNVLKKFNISESLLPPNSIIINKPFSFYKIHRNKIIGISVLIVLLVFIVIILMFSMRIQKQAKSEISFKNKNLEKTSRLLKKSNLKLRKALKVARQSKELKKANKQLTENEKTLQELNHKLKVSNLTKDKFFTIIAHDLRSPFSSILGISTVLKEDFDTYNSEQQKNFLGMINSTLQKTYDLLENLLLWARSQQGDITFTPSNLNLYTLTNDSLQLIRAAALKKAISLSNNIPHTFIVNADKSMLLTIIRNITSNAIKFTPRGGEIELNARIKNIENNTKMVEIAIIDSGVGIPKDMLLKIFDIGEDSSTKGTENETGTGLGLIICKEFIEKHKGSVWAENNINQGSTFKFTIPASISTL